METDSCRKGLDFAMSTSFKERGICNDLTSKNARRSMNDNYRVLLESVVNTVGVFDAFVLEHLQSN